MWGSVTVAERDTLYITLHSIPRFSSSWGNFSRRRMTRIADFHHADSTYEDENGAILHPAAILDAFVDGVFYYVMTRESFTQYTYIRTDCFVTKLILLVKQRLLVKQFGSHNLDYFIAYNLHFSHEEINWESSLTYISCSIITIWYYIILRPLISLTKIMWKNICLVQ